jgi:hypothetical protein
MATKSKDSVHDLAQRRHVLRVRIQGDERKLAIAYPEDAAKLEADLERERAMLAEIDAQVEAAKEQATREYRETIEHLFALRDTLLKLNGWSGDPGFRDTIFTKCHISADGARTFGGIDASRLDPAPTLEVKQALLRVTTMAPPPEPEVSDSPRLHEERVRNERAGLGHWTDAELKRKGEDELAFAHGRGAHVLRKGGAGRRTQDD